jgi:copper chaperone CopZ
MPGVNPQGTQVHSFKAPSAEELDHDFLWRSMKALPERSGIGSRGEVLSSKTTQGGTMKTSVIGVHDMLSVWSVDEVEKRIGKVPGVESVTVNYAAGSATVRYDETRLEIADIKSAVRQGGYEVAAPTASAGGGHEGHTGPSTPSATPAPAGPKPSPAAPDATPAPAPVPPKSDPDAAAAAPVTTAPAGHEQDAKDES